MRYPNYVNDYIKFCDKHGIVAEISTSQYMLYNLDTHQITIHDKFHANPSHLRIGKLELYKNDLPQNTYESLNSNSKCECDAELTNKYVVYYNGEYHTFCKKCFDKFSFENYKKAEQLPKNCVECTMNDFINLESIIGYVLNLRVPYLTTYCANYLKRQNTYDMMIDDYKHNSCLYHCSDDIVSDFKTFMKKQEQNPRLLKCLKLIESNQIYIKEVNSLFPYVIEFIKEHLKNTYKYTGNVTGVKNIQVTLVFCEYVFSYNNIQKMYYFGTEYGIMKWCSVKDYTDRIGDVLSLSTKFIKPSHDEYTISRVQLKELGNAR